MKLFLVTLVAVIMCSCAQLKIAFTDIEIACQAEALAQSVIPAGTPVAQVAQDIALGCGIADALIPDIEAVVTAWMASQADGGTVLPAGSVYKPAPFVAVKIAAKKAPAAGAK